MKEDPVKLYYFPIAPNPTRVRIYVGEKGIDDLEMELVSFIEGQQKSAAHRRRNPLGRLPVLELDDGNFLTESTAIIEYLEELHPDPPMIGTTPEERAKVRELDRLADVGVLTNFARTVHATNSPLGRPRRPEVAMDAISHVPEFLAVLNHRLEQHAFLGGDHPCIADCTLRAAYGFAEFGGIEVPSGFTQINRWRKAMDERPSVKSL
jgi:glutathione S-transferase